jgi:hypothetical protein
VERLIYPDPILNHFSKNTSVIVLVDYKESGSIFTKLFFVTNEWVKYASLSFQPNVIFSSKARVYPIGLGWAPSLTCNYYTKPESARQKHPGLFGPFIS